MTPAIQQLKQQKITYEVLQYQHDVNSSAYGLEVVEKLKLNAESVFKTLVLCTDSQQLVVALVPVSNKLNLKALAKSVKAKKVAMADIKKVENTTGYILGGVSPIGQKKRLLTIIDSSAKKFTTLYVSGGKRGLEIALSPSDLAQLTKALFAQICD
jgi:Cys-tRNA(Pro)/Cys-tRNA(Cys) deacylase